MKIGILAVCALFFAGCASQPKLVRPVFNDRAESGHYERLYTKGALLESQPENRYRADFLMFLVDSDEQGMFLFSTTRMLQIIRRTTLLIDGEQLPLQAKERLIRHGDREQKQGLFFPVSRQLMQRMAAAKVTELQIERHQNYIVTIPNQVKDWLSLLLVSAERIAAEQLWQKDVRLTANARNLLEGFSLSVYEEPIGKPRLEPWVFDGAIDFVM